MIVGFLSILNRYLGEFHFQPYGFSQFNDVVVSQEGHAEGVEQFFGLSVAQDEGGAAAFSPASSWLCLEEEPPVLVFDVGMGRAYGVVLLSHGDVVFPPHGVDGMLPSSDVEQMLGGTVEEDGTVFERIIGFFC